MGVSVSFAKCKRFFSGYRGWIIVPATVVIPQLWSNSVPAFKDNCGNQDVSTGKLNLHVIVVSSGAPETVSLVTRKTGWGVFWILLVKWDLLFQKKLSRDRLLEKSRWVWEQEINPVSVILNFCWRTSGSSDGILFLLCVFVLKQRPLKDKIIPISLSSDYDAWAQ